MKLYFQYGCLIAFLSQIYFVPYDGFIAPPSLGLILLGIAVRDELCKKPVLLGAVAGALSFTLRVVLQISKGSVDFLPVMRAAPLYPSSPG